jgi:hypothetical protein
MQEEWPERDVDTIFKLYDDNDVANAAVLQPGPREHIVTSYNRQPCIELPNVKLLMTVQPKTPEKDAEIQASKLVMHDVTPVYHSTIQDCNILKYAYYIGPDMLHREPSYCQELRDGHGFSHNVQTAIMLLHHQLRQVADAIDRIPNVRAHNYQFRKDAVYEAFAPNGWMNRDTQNPHELYVQHYLKDIRDNTPIDVAQETIEMFNRFEQHFACLPSKLPESVRCTRAMKSTMQEYLQGEFIRTRPESVKPLQRVLDKVRDDEGKAWEAAYDALAEELQDYKELDTGTIDIDYL